MTRYTLAADGTLTDAAEARIDVERIENTRLHVGHLVPHVLTVTLPKGDVVKIKVEYSCHCWTEKYDETVHDGLMIIMDGIRPRAFCPDRFAASYDLGDLLRGISRNRLYLTVSDRNYGMYNATQILDDGTAYTAFFSVKPDKGRFNGVRHKLSLFVESAHRRPQPEAGQKVSVAAIVGQALKGKRVKYFKR